MCPNRDWFVDSEELNDDIVYTANDIPCTTKGIGSIHLKNHDGSIRTLTVITLALQKCPITLFVLIIDGLNACDDKNVIAK